MFSWCRKKKASFRIKVENPKYDWNQQLIVLGKLPSASVDFYFGSRKNQVKSYIELDVSHPAFQTRLHKVITPGAMVIVVRDIPIGILHSLLKFKASLAGVGWFIDDDIPDICSDRSLPKLYRSRLSGWYVKAKPVLEDLCSTLIVSTEYLAEKYKLSNPSILSPAEPEQKTTKGTSVSCFYHGSSSHVRDWEFIIEVARKVQQRNRNISFEFIGDHALYKQCKGIPRVKILHPMSWQDYLSMTSCRRMDIGLAPLMENPFNRARSHTKFLDICRQYAVGIYSSDFPYSEEIKATNSGIVLPNDLGSWVRGIEKLALLDRKELLANAQNLKRTISDQYDSLSTVLARDSLNHYCS